MDLNLPVSSLPFVGPSYAKKLKKLKIQTLKDLLYHVPHRYEDFSQVEKIQTLQPGETVTIKGQIVAIKNIFTRSRKQIQQATVSDGQDSIDIIWFNQPFIVKTLPIGTYVSLSGRVEASGRKRTLISPKYEKISHNPQPTTYNQTTIHTGRLVPIYPETEGISSRWLRARFHQLFNVLNQIDDPLPSGILTRYHLLPLAQSLSQIHLPENFQQAQTARRRFAFDELLELHLRSLTRKKEWKEEKLAHKFRIDQEKIFGFTNSLPFSLTNSQNKAIREILNDLAKSQPMNRLLEGDVGSGKTVVAALACYLAHLNGFQAAIMAPTQILAIQHFQTLESILKPLGVTVDLRTSSQRVTSHGSQDVLVGTHSLVQKGVSFKNLGLAIIDEQHRFGVRQRALLSEKSTGSLSPHILTMTATPIPRTVALVAYGDLDLSTLDELPKGRIEIKTWVVPPQKREAAYNWIRDRVKNTDEQAFIVCPLIEESEKEGMKSIKAAKVEFERLSKKVFPDLRLGLLHGKVKNKEKNEIMERLKKGDIDVLVATPVVEVGIDIPNATIMMIEGAERFGLAQLHQLRGRVGRGTKQSYCLLFSDTKSENPLKRLKNMERTLSGRKLAELDLEIRGPGELYGTAQHGFPELKVASFADVELIKAAQEVAEELINSTESSTYLQSLLKKESIALN